MNPNGRKIKPGDIFGKLKVLSGPKYAIENGNHRRAIWEVECSCGRTLSVRQNNLLHQTGCRSCSNSNIKRNNQEPPPVPAARWIELNKGQFTLVDAEDYNRLNMWKWSLSGGYAVRGSRKDKAIKTIYMHVEILSETHEQIDHINRNKLDNRKINLRVTSLVENCWNKGLRKDNTTGFKGVSWNKKINKYKVYITCRGKHIYCGSFINSIDAARAYNNKALEFFGEFAVLNDV